LGCHGASLSCGGRRQRCRARSGPVVRPLSLDEQNDYQDQTKRATIARLGRFSTQLPGGTGGGLSPQTATVPAVPCVGRPARERGPGRVLGRPFAQQGLLQVRSRRECYLSLSLPDLSLPLPGLSLPPARSFCALPSRLSGRPGGSARWLLEESLPSPEPAARDGGGWLVRGLAASAAPRPGPGAATAVLVWASSTIRPRAVPMRAPSSAPTTTKSWPRRRSDRSTGPPREDRTLTTLPKPAEAKRRQLDLDLPADQPAMIWAPVSRLR